MKKWIVLMLLGLFSLGSAHADIAAQQHRPGGKTVKALKAKGHQLKAHGGKKAPRHLKARKKGQASHAPRLRHQVR